MFYHLLSQNIAFCRHPNAGLSLQVFLPDMALYCLLAALVIYTQMLCWIIFADHTACSCICGICSALSLNRAAFWYSGQTTQSYYSSSTYLYLPFPSFFVIGRLYGNDMNQPSSRILLHIHGVRYPASIMMTSACGKTSVACAYNWSNVTPPCAGLYAQYIIMLIAFLNLYRPVGIRVSMT
jgi:hypothetical protein